jgi:GntR family transcriptional regulator
MNNPAPTFSPLYRQIKGLIMHSLESGQWRPGEAIPSEVELAVHYKVSQGTVRKAIDELAAEKHLLRRQGKGTYVATHDEARAQFRFLRLMPDEGEQEWPASRLLDCKRARASAEIARLLELRAGDGVVLIRRVLNFADEPTVFEQI